MSTLSHILLDVTESLDFVFNYQPDSALNFGHRLFPIFFAFVLLVLLFVRDKIFMRNAFLTMFSLFFYFKSGYIYVFLLVLSTIVDYHLGKKIYQTDNDKKKKRYILISLIVNLGLLAYFKYSFFIVEQFNFIFGTSFPTVDYFSQAMNGIFDTGLNIDKLIVPVGISFYTFQTISYSIDIYRKRIKPVNNIMDFAFYVTFFPQLVAGPIVRANEFVPQIYSSKLPTKKEYGAALALILGGAIKKLLVADYIGTMLVKDVFSEPEKYSGFMNLMGGYGYSLQIYGDFSGYSDMAIGMAALMGFYLPMNFNSPYKAVNITDFWRRWHISLSSWLKDYLYIPLGGNRKGKIRTYINLFLTMLLGGLWHGANTRFIIWGGMHGAALAFNKYCNTLVKIVIVSCSLLAVIFGLSFIFDTETSSSFWIVAIFFTLLFVLYLKSYVLRYIPLIFTLIGTILITISISIFSSSWILGGLLIVLGIRFIIKDIYLYRENGFVFGENGVQKFISQFVTFHFVQFCWLFFAATSGYKIVGTMLQKIAYEFNTATVWQVCVQYKYVIAMMTLGFIIHFTGDDIKMKLRDTFATLPDLFKAMLIVIVILLIYQVQVGGPMPFIYFSF